MSRGKIVNRMPAARWVALLACLGLSLLVPVSRAGAAPADLDRSFGRGGLLNVTPAAVVQRPGYGSIEGMALAPDDEIFLLTNVRGDCAQGNPCRELLIAKYAPEGRPEPVFAVLPWRATSAEIMVDRAGRVLVAAAIDGGIEVTRLLADGSVDRSFGADGRTSFAVAGELSLADLAIAPGGDLLLSTTLLSQTFPPAPGFRSDVIVFRLDSNGVLDSSFGRFPGMVILPSQGGDYGGEIAAIGGEAVVAAAVGPQCCDPPKRRLIRIAANGSIVGSLDSAVGSRWDAFVGPILKRKGGGAWVIGSSGSEALITGYRRDWHTARFGKRGSYHLRAFSLGSNPTAATDGAGHLVLAGLSRDGVSTGYENLRLTVLRRKSNGRVDRSFAGGHRIRIRLPDDETKEAQNLALGIQSDGGIVLLAGSYNECVRSCVTGPSYFLIRLRGGSNHAKCDGRRATIVGTRRSEVLIGTHRRDVIVGFRGDDTILGRRGNDLICGGQGADAIDGGRGRDRLFGGRGADAIAGGPGHDRQRQ